MASDDVVADWYARMLEHSRKAEEASAAYNRRKPGIVAHIERRYAQDFSRRTALKESWTLTDLLDTWNWHRRGANRLAALIAAEAAFRQMFTKVEVSCGQASTGRPGARCWPRSRSRPMNETCRYRSVRS